MASKSKVTSKVAKDYKSMVDAVANRQSYGLASVWRPTTIEVRKVS